MNYTDEQLAALANKGAEAALEALSHIEKQDSRFVCINRKDELYEREAPARIAYAAAVLEGAEAMKPKVDLGEPLITYPEFTDWQHPNHYLQPSEICKRLNGRHAERVAALKADIENLDKRLKGQCEDNISLIQLLNDNKQRAEKAEAQVSAEVERWGGLMHKWEKRALAAEAEVKRLQELQDAWNYVNLEKEVPVSYSELLLRVQAAEAELRTLKQQPVATAEDSREASQWPKGLGKNEWKVWTNEDGCVGISGGDRDHDVAILSNSNGSGFSRTNGADDYSATELGELICGLVNAALRHAAAKSPWDVSPEVATAILHARDAHLYGYYDEVHHELYRIADPEFSQFEPWARLEKIAGGLYRCQQTAPVKTRSPWTPCAERMPTLEDGDEKGNVLWLREGETRNVRWVNFRAFTDIAMGTHWMPIPPLPESEPKPEPLPMLADPLTVKVEPTPPEGYHLATDEERKCLPEGYIWTHIGERPAWRDGEYPGSSAVDNLIYACPNPAPFRVTFDADGKINPPPFGQWWLAKQFVPEMLAEGHRPMLEGEKIQGGDEYSHNSKRWRAHPTGQLTSAIGCRLTPDSVTWVLHRTKRPLPPAPVEEWVPLSAEDVPPGSVFRHQSRHSPRLRQFVEVCDTGVSWVESDGQLRHCYFSLLADEWQILRPGQTEWAPCRKPKPKA